MKYRAGGVIVTTCFGRIVSWLDEYYGLGWLVEFSQGACCEEPWSLLATWSELAISRRFA